MRLRCCLHVILVSLFFVTGGVKTFAEKNILMIAGPPSHGYGAHEHYAGLKILEEAITSSTNDINVTVVRGWPESEKLNTADSIVIYTDGGGRHVAMEHREELRERLSQGCGLVCIHYAVEMLPGESGTDWVELLGGHFEINYSVNPHWIGDFKTLPNHPVTRGVKPFQANDEWYFHLRFSDEGKVTPILAAVAPLETMARKDGGHSGNPLVRKSVERGEKQTVAWTYDRPDGGRSFGFTGGHYHWNWANADMLRLVTNAIRWTAGDEIEPDGASLGEKPVDMKRLLDDQDYNPDESFNVEAKAKEFGVPLTPGTAVPEPDPAKLTPKKKKRKKTAMKQGLIDIVEHMQTLKTK